MDTIQFRIERAKNLQLNSIMKNQRAFPQYLSISLQIHQFNLLSLILVISFIETIFLPDQLINRFELFLKFLLFCLNIVSFK